MFRILSTFTLALLLISPSAWADDHDGGKKAHKKSSDFARYNVNLAGSLFGPSANFGYNVSKKTMFVFAMGMFSGDAPIKPEIGGTEYSMNGSASWMGFFVNHRPVKTAPWFRLVAGLGIGNIDNELDDGDGNTYSVVYSENPVGYLGIGFGTEAKKGFLWGFDIGVLQTGGATVIQTQTDGTSLDQTAEIKDSWMFGTLLPNVQFSLGWGF